MSRQSDRSYSECLADHAARLCAMPLSDEVLEKARMCLLDHLSAVFSACGGDVHGMAAGTADAFGDGPCSMLGTARTGSLMGATFHNALMATAQDLDDIHRYASGLHLGATAFPALLALTESLEVPVSGVRFIRAVLAAYETSSRIVRAADAGIRGRGLHSTGAAGAFGACAGACVLLGLERKDMANALGIAASSSGGLFAFLREGSSVRHAHAAWACTNGLGAALLGRAGMTGPRFAVEGYSESGTDGWLGACAGAWEPSFILEESDRPELMNAAHKLHAACGHAAPAITGLQALRHEILPRKGDVSSILVKGYKASAALANPDPQSVAQAKFSLPFLTGVVLLFGRATLREMKEETLRNPEVRRLAALTRVEEDADLSASFPRLRAGEVTVTFRNGDVLRRRVDAPLGMPENPVPLSVIEEKFRDAVDGVLSPAQGDGALGLVRRLEKLDSVSELTGLLRVAQERNS